MKKLVLFLLLAAAASVLLPVKLSAQDCYNSTRQQGISCYNDGDYSIAIDCFEAAKLCPDRPSEDDLDTWISKCRTKIKEAEERAAAEAEARRNQQQLASKAYMDIRRLSFWNEDADDNRLEFGVARELRYLHASFTYAGLSEVSKTLELSIKIINPDGNLEKAEGSPEGYTFTQNVTVKPGENVINLRGFGSRNAGTFMPGTYRYEVWYKGNKLYSQNFTLADTPGATVLTVDKKTALTVSLDEDGGYRSFSVNTDGDSYDVTLLPSWCSVTDKTKTAFTIKYEANNSGSKRKDWFKVSSGEKSVRIDVSQQSSGPSAEIEKVWVDHNYYYDNSLICTLPADTLTYPMHKYFVAGRSIYSASDKVEFTLSEEQNFVSVTGGNAYYQTTVDGQSTLSVWGESGSRTLGTLLGSGSTGGNWAIVGDSLTSCALYDLSAEGGLRIFAGGVLESASVSIRTSTGGTDVFHVYTVTSGGTARHWLRVDRIAD